MIIVDLVLLKEISQVKISSRVMRYLIAKLRGLSNLMIILIQIFLFQVKQSKLNSINLTKDLRLRSKLTKVDSLIQISNISEAFKNTHSLCNNFPKMLLIKTSLNKSQAIMISLQRMSLLSKMMIFKPIKIEDLKVILTTKYLKVIKSNLMREQLNIYCSLIRVQYTMGIITCTTQIVHKPTHHSQIITINL